MTTGATRIDALTNGAFVIPEPAPLKLLVATAALILAALGRKQKRPLEA